MPLQAEDADQGKGSPWPSCCVQYLGAFGAWRQSALPQHDDQYDGAALMKCKQMFLFFVPGLVGPEQPGPCPS